MVTFLNKKEVFARANNKLSPLIFGFAAVAAVCGGYILFLTVLAPQQLAEATTAATNVICNGCVGTTDIADNGIHSVDIRNGHVGSADIASSAVTSSKISDTSGVQSVDIVDGQVTSDDIADADITALDIAEGTVTGGNIRDETIQEGDIAPGAIQPNIQGNVASEDIQASSTESVFVDCPAGTIATGGGFNTANVVSIFQNLPFDSDTWLVSGDNPSTTTEHNLQAWVVCIGPMP